MTSRRVVVIVVLVLVFGELFGIELPTIVLFGWARHIGYVWQTARLNVDSLITNAVWVTIFAIGAHFMCRWLYRGMRRADAPTPPRWRKRWTASGLVLVVLSFVASTSSVAILHQLLFLSASQEPMYAFRDRSPQLRTTDELRDFAGTALDSIPSGYTPREWAIDAARPRSDPGSHFDRHNHMLAMPDRDGKLAAVVIFHRDPRIREQVGIAIATAAGAELRPASDLTAVLSQYAVTPERAQAPATSHASDGVH